MNIELGDIIVKKVVDQENSNLTYYIFFKVGNLIQPIMILDDWQIEKLTESLIK